jgi:hypothetical protein
MSRRASLGLFPLMLLIEDSRLVIMLHLLWASDEEDLIANKALVARYRNIGSYWQTAVSLQTATLDQLKNSHNSIFLRSL